MFSEQFSAAIESASLNGLDNLARTLWQGFAAGAIADADASHLAELIEARRRHARKEHKPIGIPPGRASIFPPRRVQRSPDRAQSLERRRRLATSGVMPPSLAARFTVGELAVLRIIADAVRDGGGRCVLPVDAIAARAGVCRRLAQSTIREAALQGLLVVQERRREGRRNDYNVVRITNREWLTWIARGTGCKKIRPTDTRTSLAGKNAPSGTHGGTNRPAQPPRSRLHQRDTAPLGGDGRSLTAIKC